MHEIEISDADLQSQAQEATAILRSRYLVGLFNRPGGANTDTQQVASGFLVKYRGHHYIASCGHALESPDFDIWLTANSSFLAPTEVCNPSVDIQFVNDHFDLGYVRIENPQKFLDAGMSFLAMPDTFLEPLENWHHNSFFVLLGYPWSAVKMEPISASPGGIIAPGVSFFRQNFCNVSVNLQEVVSDTDTAFEIGTKARDPNPDVAFHFGGFSGGPIFRLDSLSGLRGDPCGFQVVGIQFSQRLLSSDSVILKAHHIRHWATFVSASSFE